MEKSNHPHMDKISAAGLLVALGIIYGDIGTSPLYVLRAIANGRVISEELILGGLSLVFWTLTLQTTVKYVILTLRADNKGEGGILALFSLVKRRSKYLTIPAIIGASALMADGIITPPFSVASAVEGLLLIFPNINTTFIIICILTLLFIIQALGTKKVGFLFGPVMTIWFVMLAVLGFSWVIKYPMVLKAINPYYGIHLLTAYPKGFWLLGAVFLCTTGAEALYSDLGHCGRGNIRITWVFVKSCLLLNYMGQAAYLLTNFDGQNSASIAGFNPFFGLMPKWFLLTGTFISISATVIASQALISGSFTLISEAIRLHFWPKVRINYPSDQKGQLYIPSINIILWLGYIFIVFYFKKSENMEAAYGLSITLTMMMTTILLAVYLLSHKFSKWFVVGMVCLYTVIEGSFLIANLERFPHGGYITILLAGLMAMVMVVWHFSQNIKNRLTEYVKLDEYLESLKELSSDVSVPKYATHLVFLSNASRSTEIENKIIYSIFNKRPKRADVYWFLHVDNLDEPNTFEYKVKTLAPDDVYKINFRLGFKVPQKINTYFKCVLEEMVKKGEVDIRSRYESLNKLNLTGDIRFVVLEKFLSYDNELSYFENIIMKTYFAIKNLTPSEDKWFGLDSSSVKLEKYPLVIRPVEISNMKLKRVDWQ